MVQKRSAISVCDDLSVATSKRGLLLPTSRTGRCLLRRLPFLQPFVKHAQQIGFTELHGNLAVHEITKVHLRTYKEALQKLPRSCSAPMREMTVPELLDHLERHPTHRGRTLSAGSVNKAIGALQTVFGWIEGQGYLDAHPNWSNPAVRMKVHDPAKDEYGRLPYDTEDLKTIFGSAVFRDAARPQGGGGEAAKWLPLIALFTGARLEEIGQALTSDVKHEHGIHYLDINTQIWTAK